jgi:hypothetical protein
MSDQLPERDALKASVGKLLDELGVQNLTRRVLLKRLALEYKVDFQEHKKLLDEIVMEKMQEPSLKKELAKAAKAAIDGPSRGTKAKTDKKKGKDDEPKGKKVKREKEEGEPARAQSGFFFFSNEKRPALMEEDRAQNGGKVSVSNVAKKIGELWNALDAAAKAPYEAKAAVDKARFEKEKSAWIAGGGGKNTKAGKAAKPQGPKRPQNASFLYMNENREAYKQAHPDAKFGDIAKGLADEFKNLPAEQKKKYEDKAANDKARYDKEVAELKQK